MNEESIEPNVESEVQPAAEPKPEPQKGLDIFGDEAPESLRAYDKLEKDFSISAEEFEALPPQAKLAVANFRRAFLRKTQEVASRTKSVEEQRADLERVQAQLAQQKVEVLEGRKAIASIFDNPQARAALEKLRIEAAPTEDDAEFGPAAEEKRIKQGVLAVFEQLLSGVQEQSATFQKQLEEQRAAAAREARVREVVAFKAAHPDFDEYVEDIKAIRRESNYTLTAERAYELARAARRSALLEEQESVTKGAVRDSRAATGRPVRGGRPEPVEPPPGLTPIQRAQWFHENPEAHRRFNEKHVRMHR